jgi:hypothetical protein
MPHWRSSSPRARFGFVILSRHPQSHCLEASRQTGALFWSDSLIVSMRAMSVKWRIAIRQVTVGSREWPHVLQGVALLVLVAFYWSEKTQCHVCCGCLFFVKRKGELCSLLSPLYCTHIPGVTHCLSDPFKIEKTWKPLPPSRLLSGTRSWGQHEFMRLYRVCRLRGKSYQIRARLGKRVAHIRLCVVGSTRVKIRQDFDEHLSGT